MRVMTGMFGLGDNLYQRAIVRKLGKCGLYTPWPEIYADLDVDCYKATTSLRTQFKHIQRAKFKNPPSGVRNIRLGYDHKDTMLESLERSINCKFNEIDFSGPPIKKTNEDPYIVVRPVVRRKEWDWHTRNPLHIYIEEVVQDLKSKYKIISVADLEVGKEWIEGPEPFAHDKYHKGELNISDLLQLIGNASGVIGGVGWLLPMALAYKTPMLCIFGGCGTYNGPQRVFDKRVCDYNIVKAYPDNFCMCNLPSHNCDKVISNFGSYLDEFKQLLSSKHSELR